MVMVGTFPVRWTEGEVVDVVWDDNGHGIRGGVSADDNYFWIGIGSLYGICRLMVAYYCVYKFRPCGRARSARSVDIA